MLSIASRREASRGGWRSWPPHKVGAIRETARTRAIGCWLPRLGPRRLNARLLPERLHGVALHLQVGRDVATRRGDTCMADVIADHRDIGHGLLQRDGAAVPQHVRCDVLALQRWVGLSCRSRMLGKYIGGPVARHRLAVPVEKHALLSAECDAALRRCSALAVSVHSGSRRSSLPLPTQANLARGDQVQVVPAHAGNFADTGPQL